MNRVPRCMTYFAAMVLLALCTTVTAASAASSAPSDMPALGSETAGHVLRGQFVQHKHLAELDQPLVSRGRYVVDRDRGLLWQVEKPVKSTLVITPKALTESSQGQQTAHISAEQQPALGAVASILLAVFQGNTGQLSQYFDIQHPNADAQPATLVLTPKTDAVKQFITRLKLTGDEHTVHRIRIDQPGGDYSVIDLQPAPDDTQALTPAERRAFSH
ncbi:outer membrane lipoprotein carrier protein LolA [Salinisphaera hydrothermalis]|uniref:outer membrane lipoprotein carrier protein LolA n=1 Tax=Salinisphaera hydrothermalis TaxID=563188 RepID=UPI0033415B95